MIRLDAELMVMCVAGGVDLRKSIDGLAAIVEQSMKFDPFERAVYVFGDK